MRINAITNEVVRVTQGLLPFQYESGVGEAGLTGLAGLPLYLELWRAAGLEQSVARHVAVSGRQGWSDRQMVSALVLLNLAGGEGLDDLDRLEADGGLCRLVRAADAHGRTRREQRERCRRAVAYNHSASMLASYPPRPAVAAESPRPHRPFRPCSRIRCGIVAQSST